MKKLKFGIVGGGLGSFIGEVHRRGIQLDHLAEIKAGCFSRNRDKSLKTADAWGVDPQRVYSTYSEMAEYYDVLAEQGKVGKSGWGTAKVIGALCLDNDGHLTNILSLKVANDKVKELPVVKNVPEQVTRTAGVKANFLCDGPSYFLGFDAKGNAKRAKQCFDAAAALHLSILDGVDSIAAHAIFEFFTNWDPDAADPLIAEHEAAREDGIDFVVIVTPNSSHYEIAKCFMEHGIHIMCDKPLAITVEQAEELQRIAKERDIQFGVSYGYTGYPMIRQAREMIRNGAIGEIVHVRVQHPEDWVIESVSPEEDKNAKLPWRFDPKTVGSSLCTGDLGTHAEQLLVQFTGLHIKRVLAMLAAYPSYLPLETNSTVLLDLGNGVQGELWASQIAIGKPCSAGIYVIGSEGALEWNHETPSILRYTKRNGATQLLEAGKEYTYTESSRLCYASAGHHDGFNEAFGSIYHSYCEVLLAKLEGRAAENYTFPTVDDGVDGMRFVEACVKSHQNGNVWVDVK